MHHDLTLGAHDATKTPASPTTCGHAYEPDLPKSDDSGYMVAVE